MIEILALSTLLSGVYLSIIPPIRRCKYFSFTIVPLMIVSVTYMSYGYFFSEQTEKLGYKLREVSEETYWTDKSVVETKIKKCFEIKYITRDRSLFIVSEMIDKGFILPKGEVTDIMKCKGSK